MPHSTPSNRNFERREILRELAGTIAEQCGFLMGNDKALTKSQRAALLQFTSTAWAVKDGLAQEGGK